MPYKDKKVQKEYQRKWMAKRRSDFFIDKKCLNCGSKESLQLHHRSPEEKECHNIWSWSEKRRLEEIKKCDVLCHDCHVKVHVEMGTFNAKLTKKEVVEIKNKLLINNKTQKELAKEYGVSRSAIVDIKFERSWKHIVI